MKVGPAFLPQAYVFGDLRTWRVLVEMGDFFWTKWFPSDRRVRAPCLDGAKGWRNVGNVRTTVFGSYFECGLDEPAFTMVVGIFFCCLILGLSRNGATEKKTGNVVLFSSVAPARLHRENRCRLCLGHSIWESNVDFLGGRTIWFIPWWRKKEMSDISQKWMSTK